MKRIILSIALVLGTIGASAQLMYKISGNGLEKPSYVVGTHRLAPAAMAQCWLPRLRRKRLPPCSTR